jgi:hypothetical protein
MLMITDDTRRPHLSHIPFWWKHNQTTPHYTLLPLALLITNERRGQPCNSMGLRSLQVLAKITARRMVIQRTEMLWNSMMLFCNLACDINTALAHGRGKVRKWDSPHSCHTYVARELSPGHKSIKSVKRFTYIGTTQTKIKCSRNS